MKKIIIISLVLLLSAVIVVAAIGTQGKMVISDAVASEGDTIYLTVSLKNSVISNAMAISYEYDAEILEPLSDQSKWIPQGTLTDFSSLGNQGVWANKEATEMSGEICVLAFRILPDAEYKRTSVRCSLIIQNADAEQNFKATARITPECVHKFEKWEDLSSSVHIRACKRCGREQEQLHTWAEVKDKNTASVHVCTTCGGEYAFSATDDLANGSASWGSVMDSQTQWGNTQGSNGADETSESSQAPTMANNPWMSPYNSSTQEIPPTTEPDSQNGQGQVPDWMEHWLSPWMQNQDETNVPSETGATEDSHKHN